MNAIVLTPTFKLVAGHHRLEACKKLGWDEIPVKVVTLDDMQLRLAAIDENLIRRQLTKLEEAEYLSERKDIYVVLHPETVQGVAGALAKHKGAKDKPSFAEDAAEKTGQSGRNINRKIALAKNLYPEIRDLIRSTEIADSMTEMNRLTKYEPDTQKELAELIRTGKAKSVKAAHGLLNWSPVSEKIERENFDKSTRLLERALKQLVGDGVLEALIGSFSETQLAKFQETAAEDLKKLRALNEKLTEAISIFEAGIDRLNTSEPAVSSASQEMALAA